jgi:perosamine synthetase
MPVHLYGYVADLAKLSEICEKHGLSMVQDAAPAIGAMFEGKSITDYGDFTCFSFQGAKMLVTGEGGLLTTNNEELFLKAKRLVSYGRVPDSFWLESFGKKMQMSNPTAALGLGQLQSIERQISKKREIRSWYQEIFGNHKELRMQLEKEDTRSICWMSSITWDIEEFDSTQIRSALKANKIDTRQVFPPISTYPFWTGSEISRLEVSGTLHSCALNLPSGVNLSEDAVKLVANTVVRELGLA